MHVFYRDRWYIAKLTRFYEHMIQIEHGAYNWNDITACIWE